MFSSVLCLHSVIFFLTVRASICQNYASAFRLPDRSQYRAQAEEALRSTTVLPILLDNVEYRPSYTSLEASPIRLSAINLIGLDVYVIQVKRLMLPPLVEISKIKNTLVLIKEKIKQCTQQMTS